jgi:large subunit ribosomal protein L10
VLKSRKSSILKNFTQICEDNSVLILLGFKNITMPRMTILRKALHAKNAKVKVIKNAIAKISAAQTQIVPWKELFRQLSVAVVYGPNTDAAADVVNVIHEFHKNNPDYVKVLSGMLDGCMLDTKNIWDIMHIPTVNHARAQLMNMLISPMQNLSHILSFHVDCIEKQ